MINIEGQLVPIDGPAAGEDPTDDINVMTDAEEMNTYQFQLTN